MDPWQIYFENGKRKLTKDLDIERLLRTLNGFEALRSVILNKHDRFFLEYQKQRVIQTDSDHSKGSSSSDDYVAGHLAPYGQNEDRSHFLLKLRKYLKDYEGHELKETQRRILLGVKTSNANLLDKAIHEKRLKKEKEEYKKTLVKARESKIVHPSTMKPADGHQLHPKRSNTMDYPSSQSSMAGVTPPNALSQFKSIDDKSTFERNLPRKKRADSEIKSQDSSFKLPSVINLDIQQSSQESVKSQQLA